MSGIANVTSPPYDVISGGSLAHLRAADPHNVVRLILPGEGKDAPEAAASLLARWLSDGVLIRDRNPALYLYEQAAPSWRQRGIIGLVKLGSPDSAGILPHEGVMPGPVAGRRQLMAATKANLEPIFLVYEGAHGGRGPTATEIVDRVADGRAPLDAAVRRLQLAYVEALAHGRLAGGPDGYSWTWAPGGDLLAPLWPVVAAAVELLTAGAAVPVKPGQACRFLFIDQSKNGSRRWCSMDDCGKAAKIARYLQRRSDASGLNRPGG